MAPSQDPVIHHGRPSIDDADVAAVVAVLRSGWLTGGPAVDAFERSLAELTEARHAVAFSSGTAALHAAAAVSGLGPGDRVITSALTFSASAACALYVGARPVAGDIDPTTLNLRPDAVDGTADGLVAVHYAGLPMDLAALAHRPRVIIEDAAHALGARTPEGPVGNCARSDLTCFSFHPLKPITTGEGGAVTTNDDDLAAALALFRNHAMVRRPERDGWSYEISTLGYNLRMSAIHAALGTSQLRKLEHFITVRNERAERYRRALADLPVGLPPAAPPGSVHGYHLFPIRVADRRRVHEHLAARSIATQVHYVPLHHHPLYRDLPITPRPLPATDAAYEELLSLPLHPGLTDEEQDRVVEALRSAMAPG